MSLVNDMLKDLESRNVDIPDRMPEAIAIPQADDDRANPIFLLAILAMVLALVVYFASRIESITKPGMLAAVESSESSESSSHAAAVAMSDEQQKTVGSIDAVPDKADSAVPADIVVTLAALPAPAVGNKNVYTTEQLVTPDYNAMGAEGRLNILLQAAQSALAAHRLTTPVDNNAWDYVQQALLLAPDNALAHSLADAIVDEYIGLINSALQKSNVSSAERLLARALVVSPMDARLQSLQGAITDQPVPFQRDAKDIVSINNISQRPSHQQQEKQALAEAINLWQQGQTSQAVQVLEVFLEAAPSATNATTQLFDWYSSSDQWEAAEQLLSQSQKLPRSAKAFMTAQLLVHKNDINAAITILQNNAPAVADSITYHAYLAGLYQKQGQYAAAANHYRQLLVVEPKQATFWLGLGVALDALKDRQALQAYLQIGSSPELSAEVRRFVLQRIQVLSS